MENPKIFLSHSSEDKELAEELANQIRSFLGFSQEEVFVSSEPEGIDIGTDWFKSVVDALKQAEAFIILITPNSVTSNWVWFEIGYFWNKNNDAIYPLFTPPTKIPHSLNTLQAKVLTDLRSLNVFFNKLFAQFEISKFNLESNDLNSIITLAIQGESTTKIQMKDNVIKAKLSDYVKNEYKSPNAIIYAEIDQELKLPTGSTKSYIKLVVEKSASLEYIIEEESENFIRFGYPPPSSGYIEIPNIFGRD